jgi:hypothetical protein
MKSDVLKMKTEPKKDATDLLRAKRLLTKGHCAEMNRLAYELGLVKISDDAATVVARLKRFVESA